MIEKLSKLTINSFAKESNIYSECLSLANEQNISLLELLEKWDSFLLKTYKYSIKIAGDYEEEVINTAKEVSFFNIERLLLYVSMVRCKYKADDGWFLDVLIIELNRLVKSGELEDFSIINKGGRKQTILKDKKKSDSMIKNKEGNYIGLEMIEEMLSGKFSEGNM